MALILWRSLFLTALLVSDATAIPKAPWATQRARVQGRKALAASIDKRSTHQPTHSCQTNVSVNIKAPKANIWADLTESETVSVVQWLFGQSELNLTVSTEAGSWDNTL